ncbi:D-xylose transporter subunit XylF [Thermoanaerobacteraceae bacterium SP2]|jgi:D-xylose transport system substrate-binding protein|nr:D-xylose transporter subunit XylF [Thermoanaerobacteraceae bacterium SP2]
MSEGLKKTVIVVLLLILIALILLTGFLIYNSSSKVTAKNLKNEEEKSKIRIGISLGTLKEERWLKDRDILMAKLKELGADVFVQNANNDDEDQLKQVKYLLDRRIDVLILVPNDMEKAATAVQMAQKNGVRVISYDRLVTRSNVDLYISFDNVEVGKLMARSLMEKVPEGNYLIVNGAKTDNNTSMIKKGYENVLGDRVKDGRIKIIAEEWASNWMAEYAFKVTDEILQSGKRIDAVLAGNDSLAGGVIEALSEHRMAGKIPVVGQDADIAGCQRIMEGTQLMTVYKPLDKLAEKTAQMAIKLARDEKPDVKQTIYDGKFYVPYYVLEPVAVNKSNIDETVIKDGFHSARDVYRNISNKDVGGQTSD